MVHIRSITKHVNNLLRRLIVPFSLVQKLQGILLEYRLKRGDQPIVFTDWAGFRYWQFPDDNVRDNWKRKSVSDANHIVQYILDNVRPGWICVDLGAHVGSVSVPLWSRVGPNGKVISVEADPANVAKLRANLKLNGFADTYVVHAAVADKRGTLRLRCYPESNGWQTLGNPSFAANYKSFLIQVPAMTFYDLMENFGLESVELVKIDVEGAELLVLGGMTPFLKEKRIGCVIFEINHLMLEGLGKTTSELVSFWDDFDYDLWRLAPDGSLVQIQNRWPDNLIGDCVALLRRENV